MLISSRDPFECRETENLYRLAVNLKNSGHAVTLFLVQNGVIPARKSASNREFAGLIRQGIHIEVDDFSAKERSISESELKKGVNLAPLDNIIDCLAKGTKTMWH
jgi:sulfur relay (sulfurtransferase) complex TusBCD TusD component (DsrE family)|tara:strand:- start:305 stop:619 length:315 start_codon:yes stop_codon:yes gene_type:complete